MRFRGALRFRGVIELPGGDWNPEGGGVLRAVGIPRMVGVVRNHRDCRIRQELFGKRIRAVGAVDAVGAIWRYRGRLELPGSSGVAGAGFSQCRIARCAGPSAGRVFVVGRRLRSGRFPPAVLFFSSLRLAFSACGPKIGSRSFFVPFCPFSPARGPESRKKFVPSLDLSGVRIQQ